MSAKKHKRKRKKTINEAAIKEVEDLLGIEPIQLVQKRKGFSTISGWYEPSDNNTLKEIYDEYIAGGK